MSGETPADDLRAPSGAHRRFGAVRPEERAALAWACAFFFCLMAGYYILRPLREEMGVIAGTKDDLWRLFLGTFLASLATIFADNWLVSRYPRRKFIPFVYHFLALNLAAFWVYFRFSPAAAADHRATDPVVARIFFIWVTVYVVFVVSVLWSFLADIFAPERGRRLYGFVGAGATAGAIAGSAVTKYLVDAIGTHNLVLIPMVLLEVAILCTYRLSRCALEFRDAPGGEAARVGAPVGGTIWSGWGVIGTSPYLLGIAGYMLIATVTGTYTYVFQNTLVREAFASSEERVAYFASVNLDSNLIAVVIQVLGTAAILRRIGVGATLAILPVLSIVGFAVVGVAPGMTAVTVFEVLRRASGFAFATPSRELLFTVTTREEKYKTKGFIDVVVFRLGDLLSSGLTKCLSLLGLTLALTSWTAVPLSFFWMRLAAWLGRQRDRIAAGMEPAGLARPTAPATAGDR